MADSGYRGAVPFVMRQFCEPGEVWRGTFNHHLFSVTLSGGADYLLPDGRAEIRANDVLCFAPGAWQNWKAIAPEGWSVCYLIAELSVTLHALLPAENLATGIARVRLPDTIVDGVVGAFAEMVVWGEKRTFMSDRLILNRLEYALLLIRNACPSALVDERIERARSFLHDRLETPTTLDEVAQAACLSKSRLCTLFKEITGASPIQYLEELRMDRAGQLLKFSSLTVDEIAEKLCYSDRKYFDQRFKRRWRSTPYRYRKQD